jgi:hypothetical protein
MAQINDEVRISILRDEIEIFKSRLIPSHSKIDILYLADTISMLELRLEELEKG